MPIFFESEESILGSLLIDLVDNTPVTRTSGGKMRALAETVSRKMGQQSSQFDLNIAQSLLSGAAGRYLDFFGEAFSISRLNAAPANVTSSDRNVKFYVDIGTFSSINGGSSIIIPQGTIISTESDAQGILYRTLLNTVLSPTDNEAYITVRSVRQGSDINVGKNQLIYHNFIGYADFANDSLKITNDAEIIVGQDIEGDTNYKYRIANQVLAAEAANRTAVTLAALLVPGVADLVFIPYHRGIGTFDLLIKSVTPTVSTSLIDLVSESVLKVTAEGIIPEIRGPKEIGVSLVGTLTYKRALPPDQESTILENVTTNVTNYINSLDIGEEMIVNEIIERVLATSSEIKNIGTTSKPLDKIYKYTPSELEDNKVRSTIISDISAESDERIIVENRYAGNVPILIRSA